MYACVALQPGMTLQPALTNASYFLSFLMWLRHHDNSAHKYPNAADRNAKDLETSKNRKRKTKDQGDKETKNTTQIVIHMLL